MGKSQKVGGGYIFVHRLLLEHFAALESEQLPQTSVTREQQAHLPARSSPPIISLQDKDPVVQSEALSNRQGISRRKVLSSAASVGIAVIAGGFILQYFRPHPLYVYRRHVSQGIYYGVNAVAWSPNGKRIASTGNDNAVQIWDAVDGGHVYIYRRHVSQGNYYGGNAVVWSPNGKRIASAGNDTTVQVWDAADGGHVYIYRGHTGIVNTVAWSPNGMRIASTANDNTVQVWDAVNGVRFYIYKSKNYYQGVKQSGWFDHLEQDWQRTGRRTEEGVHQANVAVSD